VDLIRRPKSSLRCLLVEAALQIRMQVVSKTDLFMTKRFFILHYNMETQMKTKY